MATRKLRVLCLHGYTQSGTLFRNKTRALEKRLQKAFPAHSKPGSLASYPDGIEFDYLTAPHKLKRADIPAFDSAVTSTSASLGSHDHDTSTPTTTEEEEAYGWWVKTSSSSAPAPNTSGAPDWTFATSTSPSPSTDPDTNTEKVEYTGLPATLSYLATHLRNKGPYDAVLGFSQGACLAVLLASLLEPGRETHFSPGRSIEFPASLLADGGDGGKVHPPLKFALVFSGFRAPEGIGYDGFYARGLSTPTLHFIGSVDTVVDEGRSLAAVEACRDGKGEGTHRVVYHPGGHFVPAGQKGVQGAVEGWIREVLEDRGDDGKGEEEEKVENMDVPF